MIALELRKVVHRANQRLADTGLVMGTFGNVSAVDRALGLFVIKPSGIRYQDLTPDQMVPVSLSTGMPVEGKLRPSSDTPTHLELYRAFDCGGIVHTHSEFATVFAQARATVRCMGTTHADYFKGDIPVTRPLRADEVAQEYERNTGLVIVETFRQLGLSERGRAGRARREPRSVHLGCRRVCRNRARRGPRIRRARRVARAHAGRRRLGARLLARRAPSQPQARTVGILRSEMSRAVLWDLDGTLVDSEAFHWQSWQFALEADGVDVTFDQFKASFGQRNDRILRVWLGADATNERIARVAEAKEAEYRRLAETHGLTPLPGAADWLERLQRNGWRQAIASSAPRLNVERDAARPAPHALLRRDRVL